MKYREWINKMCSYDLLMHMNKKGINNCVVTQLKGRKDYDLCMKHQSECDKCIQELLNTERRCEIK